MLVSCLATSQFVAAQNFLDCLSPMNPMQYSHSSLVEKYRTLVSTASVLAVEDVEAMEVVNSEPVLTCGARSGRPKERLVVVVGSILDAS